MLWQIELLYFVVMIGVFVFLLLKFKMRAGFALMISAIVGAILSAIFSKTELSIRHFVEGGFAYFDTILVITMAMVFIGALEESGALDYLSAALIKVFHRFPTILLICLMLIIMFPGMITGSSLSCIVTSGALVAPIMIKIGIPKAKVGAIIAFGAVLGMIAPPINVPVMLICDVVDIPFTGFTLPLLALTIPLAIFVVLFLGRKYITRIDLDALKEVIHFEYLSQYSALILLPLIVLVVFIILQGIVPLVFGSLGMPLIFAIATAFTPWFGKKFNIVRTVKNGIVKAFPAMALLIGVGMFIQIMTLNGVRGYFVINALSLPNFFQYISMAISLPVFGGISAFGSASILGGPFVMALLAYNEIIVASSLSLLASLGEFLPPTAMSATISAKMVGEDRYLTITKNALVPLVVAVVYAMFFIVVVSHIWG